MAKIAVVNVPYNSHTEAATRLTDVLVRQGHEVVCWGHERHRERIEAAGAVFERHQPAMPSVSNYVSYVTSTAEVAERTSEELIEQLFAHEVEVIVHDSMALWGRIAGDYLGIPRVVSHPMFPIVAPHHVRSQHELAEPTTDENAARGQFNACRTSIAQRWGVEIEFDDVVHSTAPTTVAYTTREILGGFELDPGWQLVGPLMPPPPPRAPSRSRPLVYVCFGTSYNWRTELYHAVIEALQSEPVDVLISRGREVGPGSLGAVPSNVEVREFAPTREVLAEASLHVTHGGCNSVHETLLAGVPMVGIPQAYDQFPLCGRLQLLGAGVIAEERADQIGEAIRLVLSSDKASTRARELGEHLAQYDGAARVAEMVELALSNDSVPAAG